MSCANRSPPLGLKFGNITVEEGVVARGVYLGVGSPAQVQALPPSISDDYVWLYNAQECATGQTEQCIALRAGVFNSSQSRTYVETDRASWNGTGLDDDTSAEAATRIYFNDRIVLGDNSVIEGYPLTMRKLDHETTSGLGIGANSTFLEQLVATGAAPYRGWGMWAGSQSVVEPVDGAIWIGGYDTSRVNGQFSTFTSFDGCVSCLEISDLRYQYGSNSVSLLNASQTITIALQPYRNYLEVSPSIYQNLITATTAQGAFINVNSDGAATFRPNAQMGNLSVTFKTNNYTTVIPAQELFYPPRDYNNQGILTFTNTSYQISAIVNGTETDQTPFDWGIPILTMNYLVFDPDQQHFQLAPAKQGPYSGSNGALVQPLCSGVVAATQSVVTPTGTAVAGASAQTGNNGTGSGNGGSGGGHSHAGAIAGGVVGGVAGLALLAALLFFLLRSRKREKKMKEERDAAVAQGSEAGAQHERMSQYTAASPPTEISEVHGGSVDPHHHNSINTWLHSQNQSANSPNPNPPSEVGTTTMSSGTHNASATMNEPFEMPAYQYR